ncbi:signal transduction histidine kinase [Kitasatospora sp. MAA4]|uniref:sensor histidine kinase n=1 Tax=Kitasatospora sp. MAA4 TaxID=3035093 RepID=UPI002474C77B|nr:HAMP domain-containing sensor histidine kinase [Kitasatospora sp. MAA4]MDH6131633.1 signal transduction histidine kinase [Kitasatospora sp. MAA4]
MPAENPVLRWLPRWRKLAVRTRAALAAAAAAALAFTLATVLAGNAVHSTMMSQQEDHAWRTGQSVAFGIPDSPREPYADASYVVTDQNGTWLRSTNLFNQYTADTGYGRPGVQPLPLPAYDSTAFHPGLKVQFHFPGASDSKQSIAGRTVTLLTFPTNPVTTADLLKYTGQPNLPTQTPRIYVLVNPLDAEAAAANVTHVLAWYLIPWGTLFVALIAWLVTGLALRPVERIRRRMAEIGEGAFHERVPVPHARDGIARLARTTNTTLDRLEQAIVQQRQLVADTSHELRSPLATLRNSLEVPLAHPEGVDWPAVVEGALGDTGRLQDLTDDLLMLASPTRSSERTQEVELHDLVSEQIAERTHAPGPPRWTATLDTATVPGQELLVGRLVRNLLDNAARYAVEEVSVSLVRDDSSLIRDSRSVVLTVSDDGPGIPEEDRERVFERFVRLDSARDRASGGAGLGLALARTIAEGLGGTVQAVEPLDGRGARLVVRLPLSPPASS